MTLVYLWGKYDRECENSGLKAYSYRQYCTLFSKWCEQNDMAFTMPVYSGQSMELDFAGNTFEMTDRLTGEVLTIVVFVAILPYSNRTYAEGMVYTKEPQWIEVNNHALDYFGGVPAIVTPDNCKQAVIVNKDWIEPELNKDYAPPVTRIHFILKTTKPKSDPTYMKDQLLVLYHAGFKRIL